MTDGRTTMVEIDIGVLEPLRELYPGRTDHEILEGIVRAYLLDRSIRAVQARSTLSEQEAERIAYEELAAMRREHAQAKSAPGSAS
jgi:hypothetical protein